MDITTYWAALAAKNVATLLCIWPRLWRLEEVVMQSRSLGSEIIVIIVIMYHDSGSAACRCRGEEVTELGGGAARPDL